MTEKAITKEPATGRPKTDQIIFSIYRYLVAPIAVALLILLSPLNRKLRDGLNLRKRKTRRPDLSRPIWFHASSGEFEYVKPVIRKLKAEHPNIPILVTFFSPSYAEQVTNFPGVDFAEPLPLDLPGPVTSFLNHYKPRALLVARTDLWPEVMESCARRDIPVLLFATTFRLLIGLRKLLTPFYRFLFRRAQNIFCVSRFDTENLSPITDCHYAGDPRYDQVFFRLKSPARLDANFFRISEIPTVIAGSLWPEDETIVLPVLCQQAKAGKIRLILAPHEPTTAHLESLESTVNDFGLTHQRLPHESSSIEFHDSSRIQFDAQCLIVDRVGYLAELYPYSDLAFVGGSFKKKVHSVMEPLGASRPVVVGPFYKNNREAMEFSVLRSNQNLPPVTIVHDSEELEKFLEIFLKNRESFNDLTSFIESEFNKRLGATQKVYDWVARQIK